MSKYTTELRFIVESGFPLFSFDYPFYNDNKREDFQRRFIKHFFFHEIGQETAEQFKHFLEVKFNEVLPFYNEMFRTAEIEYNPLQTYDITEEYTKDNTGQSTSSGTGTQTASDNETVTREGSETINSNTSESRESESTGTRTGETVTARTETETSAIKKAMSDTPQGRVSIDTVNGDYVSSLEHSETTNSGSENATVGNTENSTATESGTNTHTGNSSNEQTENTTRTNSANVTTENTQTGNTTGKETFNRRMYGDMGVRPASYLLEEHLKFQRTIRTIEKQFFEECNDLFMEIW